MKEVSSKEYALFVEDAIENALEATLYVVYNRIARNFGFERVMAGESEDRFEDVYRSGYAAEMRDVAIRFFEEVGMDVRPDGEEW